jgi:hypothetical protein
MPAPERLRFRAPWKFEEFADSFVGKDADGHSLTHILFEDNAARREIMKRLTKDEARRIAASVAKLPQLIALEKRVRAGNVDEGG